MDKDFQLILVWINDLDEAQRKGVRGGPCCKRPERFHGDCILDQDRGAKAVKKGLSGALGKTRCFCLTWQRALGICPTKRHPVQSNCSWSACA